MSCKKKNGDLHWNITDYCTSFMILSFIRHSRTISWQQKPCTIQDYGISSGSVVKVTQPYNVHRCFSPFHLNTNCHKFINMKGPELKAAHFLLRTTRSFDVFFDLRLNKRLSKEPWGCWFRPPSWSLWRHCNVPLSWCMWLYHHVSS